jgi:hypothetical protein
MIACSTIICLSAYTHCIHRLSRSRLRGHYDPAPLPRRSPPAAARNFGSGSDAWVQSRAEERESAAVVTVPRGESGCTIAMGIEVPISCFIAYYYYI